MPASFTPLREVREIMKGFEKPWFICGGWAIDLALGKKTRDHDDIDIGIFREDQINLRHYLSSWKWFKLVRVERGAMNLDKDEYIELPIHELRAEKGTYALEILLNESDGNSWMYRRSPNVKFPKENLIRYWSGIPFWAPEVSLLYKSSETRDKDRQDFEATLPHLALESRWWLKDALQRSVPAHDWIKRL